MSDLTGLCRPWAPPFVPTLRIGTAAPYWFITRARLKETHLWRGIFRGKIPGFRKESMGLPCTCFLCSLGMPISVASSHFFTLLLPPPPHTSRNNLSMQAISFNSSWCHETAKLWPEPLMLKPWSQIRGNDGDTVAATSQPELKALGFLLLDSWRDSDHFSLVKTSV